MAKWWRYNATPGWPLRGIPSDVAIDVRGNPFVFRDVIHGVIAALTFPDKNQERERERYQIWVKNCRRDKEPNEGSRICSKHFLPKFIKKPFGMQRTHLTEDAYPTEFDLPEHLQQRIPLKRQSATSVEALRELELPDRDTELGTKVLLMMHTYHTDETNPEERVVGLEEENKRLRKSLRNAKLRERRAKDTVKSLNADLAQKNLINTELELKLVSYEGIPCELFCKPSTQYSAAQRSFALTLHLYSPKAYCYLRNEVKVSLPEPRTLRRWLEKIDGEPGVNASMMSALAEKLKQNPAEYT